MMTARRPTRGSSVIGVGRCTSVTAARMTDAYGASTPVGVQTPVGHIDQRSESASTLAGS